MGRLLHFEIHVNDMECAEMFYGEVFGIQLFFNLLDYGCSSYLLTSIEKGGS